MRVKKLRVDVRSRLESGLIITDATQCALELVENALDAKCTAVAVRINLKEFIIEVVDNGIGISPDDLNLVGERFMTSKCWNLDDVNNNMETYGYRGQAIASIIDVSSKLLINTKSKLSSKTLVKVFTKGKSPSISVSSQEKCGSGTTITVYDFMCTMPIRRKRIKEIFDVQEIKNQLEYLALVHSEVSFTLRDENKGEIILQSQTRRNAGFSFADLFGMAVGKFLLPFQYEEHKIEIEGFIALERHSENNLQFLYVNKRIVSKSLTHKFVNSVIDRYLSERQTLIDNMSDVQVINMNIRKGSHNVYLIQIRCPYSEYEMFRSLRKTTVEFKNWDRILHCLKCAIKSVLKVNTGNIRSDNVIQKRKIENINSFPRKGNVELGQLRCGIRGGFVKRSQGQLVPSDEKTVSNHVSIIEKKNVNDERPLSLTDEMLNNCPTRYELSKWLPYNDNERNDTVKRETLLNCKINELKEEKFGSDKETVENNFLMEFAVWLKSKMAHDCFIRKKYREFVTENATVCKNVKKMIFEKRDGKPCKKIEDSERNCGKKRKFCNAAKELKRVKLSPSRRNFIEDNNNNRNNDVKLNRKVKVKKLGKWKKERKSDVVDRLQSISGKASGRSLKNGKTGSGNELIEISSSSADSVNCIRGSSKQFKGCKHSKKYSADGESSRSWVSHENRATLEKKCSCSPTVNLQHERARTPKCSTREVEKEEEGDKGEHIDRRIKMLDTRESKRRREIEVQTSISALNCDQITQINVEGLIDKDKDNDNEIYTRNTGECALMNIPENGKGNAEFGRVTGEVDFEDEKISNYLKNAVEPPQVSNCKSILNDCAAEDSKGITSQNLPDTLSLIENSHIGDRKCATPFTCTNRYTFIPKGLSPTVLDRSFTKFGSRHEEIGKRSIEAPDGTWEGNSSELFSKSLLPDEMVEELRENIVKNMIHYEREPMKSYLTKSEAKINTLINSFAVDKHVLSSVKVIGQWDNKFIIGETCRMLPEEKQLLFVFDQHAVDERIRLEKLLKDSRNTEGNFISMNCVPPVRCKMDESMLRFIPLLETVLPNFGIKVSVVDSDHALFHQIPLCLVQDHVDNMEMILKNLVNEIVEEHNETRGSGSSIPRILFTILSTRACKSAIKFNVSLSSDEMAKLINNLVSCQTPFQCAHGRPTVVPILNLAALRNQIKQIEEKLDFKKFRKL